MAGSHCAMGTPRVPGRVRKAVCSRWWWALTRPGVTTQPEASSTRPRPARRARATGSARRPRTPRPPRRARPRRRSRRSGPRVTFSTPETLTGRCSEQVPEVVRRASHGGNAVSLACARDRSTALRALRPRPQRLPRPGQRARAARGCDRAARPAPAGRHRPDHRAGAGRAGGGPVRRRAGPLAAPAPGVHQVQRARLVGRHLLAVGGHAHRGAARPRAQRGAHPGPAAGVPQRARRQLRAAAGGRRATSGWRPACGPSPCTRGCRRTRAARARRGSWAWACTAGTRRRR